MAVRTAHDNLVQINVVGKGGQCFTRLPSRVQFQRRTQVNLAQLDSVLLEECNRARWFFELHRQVTGVVIHSEMFRQTWIFVMLGAEPIEKMNDFASGLQQAHRLGFQAQVELPTRLRADTGDMLDATPEVVTDELPLFGCGDQQLESAGQGAHAAFHICG